MGTYFSYCGDLTGYSENVLKIFKKYLVFQQVSPDMSAKPVRLSYRGHIRSRVKWKGPFRFFPTGIFGITSGGGPLISVGLVSPKFAFPFLTSRFIALPLFIYVGNSEKE